jgi:hypothetical protein
MSAGNKFGQSLPERSSASSISKTLTRLCQREYKFRDVKISEKNKLQTDIKVNGENDETRISSVPA